MSAMVTFNGVQVSEADVLRAAAEIQQRKEPMEPVAPGVYRWASRTDADPFIRYANLRRKNANGSWSMAAQWGAWKQCDCCDSRVRGGDLVPLQPVEGVEYARCSVAKYRWHKDQWQFWMGDGRGWLASADGPDLWRTGQLRPITPKPWVPTVGEWVQHTTQPWEKARKVTSVGTWDVWCADGWVLRENVRPATPDEITAAKRIELVDGLIVRSKDNGRVWRWNSVCKEWHNLSDTYKSAYQLRDLDLDHYDILDEYTVQGAQR